MYIYNTEKIFCLMINKNSQGFTPQLFHIRGRRFQFWTTSRPNRPDVRFRPCQEHKNKAPCPLQGHRQYHNASPKRNLQLNRLKWLCIFRSSCFPEASHSSHQRNRRTGDCPSMYTHFFFLPPERHNSDRSKMFPIPCIIFLFFILRPPFFTFLLILSS